VDILSKYPAGQAKLNVPTLVYIAAIGIITTRCLDVLMLFNTLGVQGSIDFIQRSVQTWALTLIFFASLVLLFIEIRCAFVILRGRNWGRWVFLATQIISSVYLWCASLGWGYPELFSIPGESKSAILHGLFMQKLPDLLVLALLFVPLRSRRFFRVH
jgi:hypothetical protein